MEVKSILSSIDRRFLVGCNCFAFLLLLTGTSGSTMGSSGLIHRLTRGLTRKSTYSAKSTDCHRNGVNENIWPVEEDKASLTINTSIATAQLDLQLTFDLPVPMCLCVCVCVCFDSFPLAINSDISSIDTAAGRPLREAPLLGA